jgi:hypothetical protein
MANLVSKFQDEMFTQWQQKWVPKIDENLKLLWYHREVWQQVRDLLTNEHERYGSDGTFLGRFTKMYVDSQAMAVRRLADQGKQVMSFARLIEQMRDQPSVLSRDRYRSMCWDSAGPGWSDDSADADYDRYAAPGRDELDRSLLERDLQRLLADAEKVVEYANKTVAHDDSRAFEVQVTFGELAKVVDDIAELWWYRYHTLLTGIGRVEPSIAGDPLAPFRVALHAVDD